MAKEPKKPPQKRPPLGPPLEGADGPIPWENWDNDQRAGDETPGGQVYEYLTERDKASKK
jgi:hypothetical protein